MNIKFQLDNSLIVFILKGERTLSLVSTYLNIHSNTNKAKKSQNRAGMDWSNLLSSKQWTTRAVYQVRGNQFYGSILHLLHQEGESRKTWIQ